MPGPDESVVCYEFTLKLTSICRHVMKVAATLLLLANGRLTSYQENPPGKWQAGRFYNHVNSSNLTGNYSVSSTLPALKTNNADSTYRVFPVLSIVGVGSQGRRHFAECEPNGPNKKRCQTTMHRAREPRFTLGCRPISRNHQI